MIPVVDLKREIATRRDSYLALAARVLDSGIFSLGPEVEALEQKFALYCGTKHVIGVSSGTMALYAACLALDLQPGDEVLMPANTFIASAEAVVMAGLTPIFCDVERDTMLVDFTALEQCITPRTKAIMAVHLYGRSVDMERLESIARAHQLLIIEDCSQAHGAYFQGRRVGSFGSVGCFSCYPTKNLGAIGEGGLITTNDDDIAKRIKAIRLHGICEVKYRHDIFGTNLKMEALQGAFLHDRLSRLDQLNGRRQDIAHLYTRGFEGVPLSYSQPGEHGEHVYHLFVVRTPQREALRAHLTERGIGTGIHYPIPVHLQPSFVRFGGVIGRYPVAEALAEEILSLPMFPELTDAEVERVIVAVREFFAC